MKVRDVIRRIERDGWYQVRMKGSHRIFEHAVKQGIVVIAGKTGDEMPVGTLNAVWKQAGLERNQ